MTSRHADELLSQIIASPDDDELRLVYADALEDRARAELIHVQVELARLPAASPARPPLAQREHRLLAERRDRWGAVGWRRGFPIHITVRPRDFATPEAQRLELELVEVVELEPHAYEHDGLAALPFERLRRIDLVRMWTADGLCALLASARIAQLATLRACDAYLFDREVRVIAEATLLRGLRSLELADNPGITDEGARLLAASPHLANLERLDLTSCQLGPDGVAALAASPHLANVRAFGLFNNRLPEFFRTNEGWDSTNTMRTLVYWEDVTSGRDAIAAMFARPVEVF